MYICTYMYIIYNYNYNNNNKCIYIYIYMYFKTHTSKFLPDPGASISCTHTPFRDS